MYKPINIYMYMFFYIDVHKPVLLPPKFTARENKIRTAVPGPLLHQVQMKQGRLSAHSKMLSKETWLW